MKFRVGDKVRVVRSENSATNHLIGEIFTIDQICPNGRCIRMHYGTTVGPCRHFIFYENELELVNGGNTMKKEFTKADLRSGDVIRRRNYEIGIICLETNTIIFKDGADSLSTVTMDLKHDKHEEFDIIAVKRTSSYKGCNFITFDNGYGELVYERKEVEEMTLEEVCKALGKEIKIVKK